jgi:adenylate kinase family enzyme
MELETTMPAVFCVLGGPGSGKSTMCGRIAQEYPGMRHISTGELLRDAIQAGRGPEAEAVAAAMAHGRPVSTELVLGLVDDKFRQAAAEGCGALLFDGFPRDQVIPHL